MNERIKELAEQAGMVRGGYANGTKIMTWRESFDSPRSLEKFAELIIRECANLHDMNSGYYDDNNEWCAYYEVILKHFGVSE